MGRGINLPPKGEGSDGHGQSYGGNAHEQYKNVRYAGQDTDYSERGYQEVSAPGEFDEEQLRGSGGGRGAGEHPPVTSYV